MRYLTLGNTPILIPEICLGTMTWGSQNTLEQAFEQMDYALEQGVNFWDTAEIYAVPPKAETYGETERMIGVWFADRKQRDKVILASKIVGRTPHLKPASAVAHHHDRGFYWIRNGQARQTRVQIEEAVDESLKRLQTHYIDLYQLHWPDRPSPRFGIRDFYDVEDDMAPDKNYTPLMIEIMETMADLIKQGKIRAWGLSNETPWGVMKYLALAEQHRLPKPVSIQNAYSLLDRKDEGGLSEICTREKIAYLPYSALAAGALTGKYLNNQWPTGARSSGTKTGRYLKPNCEPATIAYVQHAKEWGLDPAQMALAFVRQKPFVTSTIIGATTMDQLQTNIASTKLILTAEQLLALEAIHAQMPNPGV